MGPHTSHWLTAEAEEIVRLMDAEHCASTPAPQRPRAVRPASAATSPLCGCPSRQALQTWFGAYLPSCRPTADVIAVCHVPTADVIQRYDQQLIFLQALATLISRDGALASDRSSAGQRDAIIAANNGRYDYLPSDSRELRR